MMKEIEQSVRRHQQKMAQMEEEGNIGDKRKRQVNNWNKNRLRMNQMNQMNNT